MSAYVGDSKLFRDQFGTPEMRAVFDDRMTVQKWLDTEVALAAVQAALGMIPKEAAQAIAEAGDANTYDLAAMKAEMDRTSHPIVPLVRAMEAKCDPEWAGYLHWGATTQDIMDTGQILQIKNAWVLVERDLATLTVNLADLARKHRDTAMAGRTHGQQALPLTFGYKVAIWLDEVRRHQTRMREAAPRVFRGQFAGAVGTMAAIGDQGIAVQAGLCQRLGLGVPIICWHSARDTMAEAAFIMSAITGTMGKIANEIFLLSKTETAELEEPFPVGKVGSSTMPQKRNPAICEGVAAIARAARYCMAPAMEGLVAETERDKVVLQAEREYVSRLHNLTHAAVVKIVALTGGLQVKVDNMRRNLDITGGLLLSEAVMMALAPMIGRQEAHELIYQIAQRTAVEGGELNEALKKSPEVAEMLSENEIHELLDPTTYTGLSGVFVDRALDA